MAPSLSPHLNAQKKSTKVCCCLSFRHYQQKKYVSQRHDNDTCSTLWRNKNLRRETAEKINRDWRTRNKTEEDRGKSIQIKVAGRKTLNEDSPNAENTVKYKIIAEKTHKSKNNETIVWFGVSFVAQSRRVKPVSWVKLLFSTLSCKISNLSISLWGRHSCSPCIILHKHLTILFELCSSTH